MAIYEITTDHIQTIPRTNFAAAGLKERGDLQRLLRSRIGIIAPDTLVIAEEFGEWEDARRRVDLLGIDKQANLVVIELKRDDGGHMDLQAVRYAAMVSAMTFDKGRRTAGSSTCPSVPIATRIDRCLSRCDDGSHVGRVPGASAADDQPNGQQPSAGAAGGHVGCDARSGDGARSPACDARRFRRLRGPGAG